MAPKVKAPVIRNTDGGRIVDVMSWDALGGQAAWPMTDVRNLALPQWCRLAKKPENRCLIRPTDSCE